jgi:cytochrome P450
VSRRRPAREGAIAGYPPGPRKLARRRVAARGDDGYLGFLETLIELARTYGPVSHFRLLWTDFYLVDDPEAIRDVLVTNARDFVKSRGAESLKRLLGEGLLTSEEPLHMRRRRLVQPAFHRERIAGYATTIVEEAASCARGLAEGSVVDVTRAMMRLTLSITAKTLFGSDVRADAERVYGALSTAIELVPTTLGPFGEVVEKLPLPANFRFKRARRTLDEIIYAMIASRRGAPSDRGDLLSTLLLARDEEGGGGMSDAQVRDEAMTIFIAGHETTALALTWAWYLLSQHPPAEVHLREELADVLQGRDPVLDDLARLPYTTAVVREALRLYPPAWILGRRAIRDTTIGGYPVSRGSVVFASPYVTHRNARWFDAPEEFRPERWAKLEDLPRFAYFPFGGGTRICVGESLAWTEAVLSLATLARRWRLSLLPGNRIALVPLVTIRPKYPLLMRIEAV